jgi:two-component system, OmpR family, KDP operon response regulator KdpE
MSFKFVIAIANPHEAELIALATRMHWIESEATILPDGPAALAYLELAPADLVVLSASGPAADLPDLCRRVRDLSDACILALLPTDALTSKIRVLDSGADACLPRPVDVLELLSWMRALLRRNRSAEMAGMSAQFALEGAEGAAIGPYGASMVMGPLVVNSATRQVQLDGQAVPLTSTEYRLLEMLMKHPGKVLSHRLLLEQVWGPEYVGEDHYLKVFVRRLRKKLNDNSQQPRFIQTEWGIGYRFVPQSGQYGECGDYRDHALQRSALAQYTPTLAH